MKYDILVQTFTSSLVRKQNLPFLAQNWRRKKNCRNPFEAIIRLKKEEKKWYGPLSHWCREGNTLVVRQLKKNTFLCVSSLKKVAKSRRLLPQFPIQGT